LEEGEKPMFVTATDGNHGRAVAWTAAKLGQPASIYMPQGSSEERLKNIKATGAYAEITDMNYDDAVRFAAAQAEKTGGVIIQDTAWAGYEEIPLHIMEGYGVIADEVLECGFMPTHVFLQAGVGSFAGGIAGAFRDYCKASGRQMPRIIVAESDQADCYYRSAAAADGKPRFVGGEMRTLMAGLACGEPNPIAFDILRNEAACFVSCGDKVAADGMRILSSMGVTSGESGAVTCGILAHICMEIPELKTKLGLDERSRVLLISTEGDTDKQRYQDIVWFGRSNL
ncbi:MAG: diaminopropionate ammonia-lyase, partial [Oscillospiraceae bacterium]